MAFISLTEIYNTPLADNTGNYLAYLFETSDKAEEFQYLFSVKVLDRRHYVQMQIGYYRRDFQVSYHYLCAVQHCTL